jgi:hypothetical protein
MAGPGWGPPRLDGFILTERLGSGTYATVYKAYAKVGVGAPSPRGSRCRAPMPAKPEQAQPGAGRESWRARGLPSARLTSGAGWS